MSKSITAFDVACYILENTHDGNDLAPNDLKLLEIVVNNGANEKGEVAFYELYKRVQEGYKKPFYHGIKHLTQDHEGFIYWKGIQVEHYSFTDYDKADKEARELAERCKTLERHGVKVSSTNAIWQWQELEKRMFKN